MTVFKSRFMQPNRERQPGVCVCHQCGFPSACKGIASPLQLGQPIVVAAFRIDDRNSESPKRDTTVNVAVVQPSVPYLCTPVDSSTSDARNQQWIQLPPFLIDD